jgi:aspartyl-tRNA synthetase
LHCSTTYRSLSNWGDNDKTHFEFKLQLNLITTLFSLSEQKVFDDLKINSKTIKLEFAKLKMISSRNRLSDAKPLVLKSDIKDKDLSKVVIAKVRNNNSLKFESDTKAISQMFKRSRGDMRRFVDRANMIIRDQKTKNFVWRGQEGIFRFIEFIHGDGKVEVVENFGNIYLNSFIEYN